MDFMDLLQIFDDQENGWFVCTHLSHWGTRVQSAASGVPHAQCDPLELCFPPHNECIADASSSPPGEKETAAGAINYHPKIDPTPPSPAHLLPK